MSQRNSLPDEQSNLPLTRGYYSHVTRSLKDSLVRMVINDGRLIKDVAEDLNINYNTARTIVAAVRKIENLNN